MVIGFTVSHGSVTQEKALAAASSVEERLGCLLNGDKKAFQKMDAEDLVVLIQYARNTINEKKST